MRGEPPGLLLYGALPCVLKLLRMLSSSRGPSGLLAAAAGVAAAAEASPSVAAAAVFELDLCFVMDLEGVLFVLLLLGQLSR